LYQVLNLWGSGRRFKQDRHDKQDGKKFTGIKGIEGIGRNDQKNPLYPFHPC
jgi:hypothetical protein